MLPPPPPQTSEVGNGQWPFDHRADEDEDEDERGGEGGGRGRGEGRGRGATTPPDPARDIARLVFGPDADAITATCLPLHQTSSYRPGHMGRMGLSRRMGLMTRGPCGVSAGQAASCRARGRRPSWRPGRYKRA